MVVGRKEMFVLGINSKSTKLGCDKDEIFLKISCVKKCWIKTDLLFLFLSFFLYFLQNNKKELVMLQDASYPCYCASAFARASTFTPFTRSPLAERTSVEPEM